MASVIEKTIRKAVTPAIQAVAGLNRARLDDPSENPFLKGLHAPMTEERTLTDLAVTGSIPVELDGRYVRIGPNPFDGGGKGHHWFTGDGMVHGVRLRDGKAEWYRNRFIRSKELEAKGGPKAAPGPRSTDRDVVNTNALDVGGKIMALVEAGSYPVELDGNLESVAYSNFGGGLAGSFTAHPHQCPVTGEHHAICYSAEQPDRIRHVALSKDGEVLREVTIPVEHGPSIHDCALTENYVVILDLPVTFSMKSLLAGYRFPYRWNPEHKARVGLVPRKGDASEVIWCDVHPCYVFHVGNSFEQDGKVVIDLCAYETIFDGDMPGPYGKALGLERWTVDPTQGKVIRDTLDAAGQEFPRPDERYFTKPYRYLWSDALEGDLEFFSALPIYRHDLATGERIEHSFGEGRIPGEFVFVPRSPDAPEGDGWIMGYVIDRNARTSSLEILEALTLTPVASVHIPHLIPPGFHGNWIAASHD
ncbi:carotenoid oxygenase family protein [Qipengyuania sp. 6B39]|uniref:8'-apo-carotenoid 13,14-cleaving dioxygenase n=1 Tax=Qipengyuania proteolytica TaxID=2867239 RepID=UPI001C89793A|nr:carotenoid oxygenase family protein [Qipengyuania proteolytica]MBX7495989.1 carotenoid oxygenase family protein [Qipengyuania proteolytica]